MAVKILQHRRTNYHFIFLVILLSLLINIRPTWGHEDPNNSLENPEEEEWKTRPPLTPLLEIEREITGCCTREKKMKSFGNAVSGEELIIDVGHCRKKCSPHKPLKKKKFEKLMKENPNIDPRELFLLHSTRVTRRHPSCPKGETCSESDYRIEKLLTSTGELTVDIVENCSCQPNSKACRRHPKIVTFHMGTPLESTVDVGECRGHCGEDMKCQPVITKTTSVNGPNGVECVSLIEDCLCSSQCYRVSHYEQVYDHSTEPPNATTHGQSPFQGGGTHTHGQSSFKHTHLTHSPQVGADGSLEEWKIKYRRKNK
ncbi:hypothetical protein Anas_13426 [Armadillidium nasatum]|uniref:Uncharacterized protein n=1 Tax=Armadillidium nasatum TaxID=96803 RepID=A0A5N5T604_9CRUS|nr:hypothetical protein Anas_13426 [Armadillidium nasatum]